MAALSLSWPAVIVAIVVSYALGCIPGAPIVARRHGIDLHATSDGNPGAWNALEQLGWARAWPAFLIDGAKGAAAGALGWVVISAWPWVGDGGLLRDGGAMADPAAGHWLPWACVAAAMLGHAFPLEPLQRAPSADDASVQRSGHWRIGAGGTGGVGGTNGVGGTGGVASRRWRIGAGGKSVMTFAGGAIALVPLVGLVLTAVFLAAIVAGRAAAGARLVVFTFPAAQALVTPLVQVGWTGLLMTIIGLLFVTKRQPRATA